ncbi:hypothetical protein LEAN103870_19325 [Legionella anisa]|uniref:Uncharacterized protein n=1 Tax=Legionella anisa TaxID=28082 RepID=A0AAX0WS80_9GAMM|nr:hypothetical protein [Legionella anisa]AWN74845.1 hypothetical protein DLD14_13930 [Legionella anisa]KTC73859.1 hypothetical protein Lani_0812 [Legionella anisa]MBN5936958.1 hypothetical protein [Legionella anisa]MCW8424955.1 hypothetical protein [Legionella anisa]MCW8445925.1 hypothetical protein [Legionella anisa]
MNKANQELQILIEKLDSIVDEMKQVLVSTQSVSSNKKKDCFFLSTRMGLDAKTRIMVKIDKYKKLRADTNHPRNSELEVSSLMDIFATTEILVKKISEGKDSSEYADKGFFNRFSDISHKVERLIA